MKTSKTLASASVAFSLLAAVGAQAETYDGVHALNSARSRAEVQAEAVIAAHRPNPYAEGYGSGAPVVAANSRSTVRNEATATAHAPDQNLYREAFVGSVIPAQYRVTRPLARHAAR